MDKQVQLNALQTELLAHVASGSTLYEAADRENVSFSWAHKNVRTAKRILGAANLASCVMRAHAIGILSHPTGAHHQVFAVTEEVFASSPTSSQLEPVF